MTFDEIFSGLNIISHEFFKYFIGIGRIFNVNFFQNPVLGVHCGFPQLPCVHFTKTFVALDGNAFFAEFSDSGFHVVFIEDVFLCFAFGNFEKRRLGYVNISGFNKSFHVAEEEREEEDSDMCAIHISISHDDDVVVTGFFRVEVVAVSCTDSGDEGLDFLIFEGFVLESFFHVEDFSAKGENCLEFAVSSLFGGTSCRISFDDVEFGFGGVSFGAVGEFARHACHFEGGFSAGEFLCFAGGFTGVCSVERFFGDGCYDFGVFFEEFEEGGINHGVNEVFYVAVAEAHFCLTFELGVCYFDTDDGGESFTDVFSFDRDIFFEVFVFVGGFVDGTGEGGAESFKMGAAFSGIYGVNEGVEGFRVGGVVLDGYFDVDFVFFVEFVDVYWVLVEGFFAFVEVEDEFAQAAFVAVGVEVSGAAVFDFDFYAFVEVGEFTEAVGEDVVVKFGGFKDAAVRVEGNPGAGGGDVVCGFIHSFEALSALVRGFGTGGERLGYVSFGEDYGIYFFVAVDFGSEAGGESVYN